MVFKATMSSSAMSSQLLVLLCMVLVSLAIILQGACAARDLTHTMHASNYRGGNGRGGYYGGYDGGNGRGRGGYGGYHGGISDIYGAPP
ncbi:hypothetical protein C2845_PMPSC055888 [Panicum miliaceum]|uniref:Glycine-rich cell wall structural protein-like n=1 Tax=Panicum miliaceum TaxID=4540 RepID=A0A3L6PAF7_PANMI|nr:hypothetical protein C2845_PMPSC055888 [Panicum miliaceum]